MIVCHIVEASSRGGFRLLVELDRGFGVSSNCLGATRKKTPLYRLQGARIKNAHGVDLFAGHEKGKQKNVH